MTKTTEKGSGIMKELFAAPVKRFCLDCNMAYGPDWEKSSCLCGKKLLSKEEKVQAAIKNAKKGK